MNRKELAITLDETFSEKHPVEILKYLANNYGSYTSFSTSLGAEDQVHVGGALADGLALLAGDTTAHTNDEVRILLLQPLPAAQFTEYLFLGFFPYRTGI